MTTMRQQLLERVLEEKRKPNRQLPRVHGNGFVQLNLSKMERVHVWGHPDIPKQKVSTQIHDHTFSFYSTCIVGRLVHHRISIYENPISGDETHEIYVASIRKDEDTVLNSTHVLCRAWSSGAQIISEGEMYSFEAFKFHESIAIEPAVTVMTKVQTFPGTPKILCAVGQKPDNDFDRYRFNESTLWGIIEEVLR